MIKLYCGEDSYSLNHTLKKLEADFSIANFGDMNIIKYDAGSLTYDKLIRSVTAVPFLAPKRLVIINNLFRDADEKLKGYIEENIKKFPETTDIILKEDGEVKKTFSLYKKLAKENAVVNFPLRKGYELEKWLGDVAKVKNVPIGMQAVKKLIATAGNNSWRLINELDKLDLFRLAKNQTQISEADIDEMVESEHDQNIFDFIDALGGRNGKLALKYLQNLLLSGKNENYILSMIVYQFRNMLVVEDLIVSGVQRNLIAKEAELHPFVVQKTIRVLNNFDLPLLKRIYLRLQQADIDIKTGKIEPKLALQKLLLDLTM